MPNRSDDDPNQVAVLPTKLQEDILGLLEDAGIRERWCNDIVKLVDQAELAQNEADYDRQQQKLMENGPGPSLRDQQIAAMKFK